MQRILIEQRPNHQALAEKLGFHFHTIDGEPYWDESAYYQFTLEQIERDLEGPTEELHHMAMDLVGEVVESEELLSFLDIPEPYWDWIRDSWKGEKSHLYGRMDFAYDGTAPAKLYEINADTPTSLYEASFWQWLWLEDQLKAGKLPTGADQFNSLQDRLVERLATLGARMPQPLYFSSVRESVEDRATVLYLQDCATQAGLPHKYISVEDIGRSTDGRFTDLDDYVIESLFKLYPIEMMMRERFGETLPKSGIRLLEPAWKAVLSNKGILALLWECHPGHPNLLPTRRADSPEVAPGWVRKPYFSREGANIDIRFPDGQSLSSEGPYGDGPAIDQKFHALPRFNDRYPLIGSWVIGDSSAGIGIREDHSLITQDTSCFVPHCIVG